MFGSLVKHYNSALSRGVGYESTPPGAYFENDRVRGYFIDFRSKTVVPDDPAQLFPADAAQLALGWWERALAEEAGAIDEFLELARRLAQTAEVGDDEWRWPYPIGIRKYRTPAPTYSAMAQAQIASVFVRAHAVTPDAGYLDAALAAVRPLVAERGSDLVALTDDGPVLEESPSDPPSHILNGWIYSLWGVWDVAVATGDDAAGTRYHDSLLCLRRKLARYDVGWWTRYSLYPHRLPDLAKPFYHRLHIDQMDVLYRLSGCDDFAAAAARWRRYDTTPHRARAIAQKSLFVATRYA